MTRHLLKLLWNRKRMNALIVAEICCSFLVLFSVGAGLVYIANNVRQPIGFTHQNVWNVAIGMGQESDDEFTKQQLGDFERALREAKSIPFVEYAGGSMTPPFSIGGSNGNWKLNGRYVKLSFDDVTDGFRDVLGLELLEGRWFEPSDDAQSWRPVVVDRDAARTLFPDGSAVGKSIPVSDTLEHRIVGVVREYRKNGELAGNDNFVLMRVNFVKANTRPPRNILVKVKPGTTAADEQALLARLRAVVPEWSFELRTLEQLRAQQRKLQLLPIVIGSIIAGFLVLMVTLGLTGVMWQNVTRRTREIGLRRALGATGSDVHRQILVEILIVASFGLALGIALVLQVPVLGIIDIPAAVLVPAIVLAILAILGLVALCGLYPSLLASRVEPAEALHYE
ncbi:MAG: ABC transporter permease [Thermoanaerobaculia bacterium]|jgi:putative ABC transport system permease protein